MRRRRFQLITPLIVLLGIIVGCAGSTKVGLTNTQAREWRQTRLSNTYDVVANGDDSCQRPRSGRPDPMPIRFYRCPGKLPEGTRLATPE
jgi:hypothetical protein